MKGREIRLVEEDFFDMSRFAGEGNVGHMVEQVKYFGMGIPKRS